MAKQITVGDASVPITDEVAALADEAAKTYTWSDGSNKRYANAAEWVLDWLKSSLLAYHQQLHTSDAQKAFNKTKRTVEAMFEPPA